MSFSSLAATLFSYLTQLNFSEDASISVILQLGVFFPTPFLRETGFSSCGGGGLVAKSFRTLATP